MLTLYAGGGWWTYFSSGAVSSSQARVSAVRTGKPHPRWSVLPTQRVDPAGQQDDGRDRARPTDPVHGIQRSSTCSGSPPGPDRKWPVVQITSEKHTKLTCCKFFLTPTREGDNRVSEREKHRINRKEGCHQAFFLAFPGSPAFSASFLQLSCARFGQRRADLPSPALRQSGSHRANDNVGERRISRAIRLRPCRLPRACRSACTRCDP